MSLGRFVGAALAVIVLLGLAAQLSPSSRTATIRVLGDEGTPYEISYETTEGSHTDRGTVPAEYAVALTGGSSSEDYVRASASKLEGADEGSTGDDDLVGVDLQLVAEDGSVLDEADMEGNVLNYSLNRVSVEYYGEDLR